MLPPHALLLRLLALAAPASLIACGSDGGASDVGSTTNANSGAGGHSETAGSGGAAGGISGGSGGASAGAAGSGGASAGAGGQASCSDGEKRIAQQFCPTPSCTDVMMEVCSKGQWTCYQESCPATGGAGGAGGTGGAGGSGAAGEASGGSGGFGGYTDAVCASGFCGNACAKTTGSCGLASDPQVAALFQDCVNQFDLGEVPDQTTDSTGVTTCCWYQLCPGGRPLEIEGAWTQAPAMRRSDWS